MIEPLVLSLLWCAAGLVVGSFLNVCIVRIPRGESVIRPGSHCRHCGRPLRWFDIVPLLNMLWLRARCRRCGHRIAWHYPLVESLNGLGYLAVVDTYGSGATSCVYALLVSALLVVAMIDYHHLIIPDVIVLPGIMLGILAAAWTLPMGWRGAITGAALGGGILWTLAIVSPYLFGKEGMGGGDIKLMAMIGAFLGWRNVLLTLMLASLAGAATGLTFMALHRIERNRYLPFAPFLSAAAVVSLLFGRDLIALYESLL